MEYIKVFQNTANEQSGCPLFEVLPGEIRDRIFFFVLKPFDNDSKAYDEDTCYRRPNYFAPQKFDITLLSTCQRIYNEAWFQPWATSTHSLWLTANTRAPSCTSSSLVSFTNLLTSLKDNHGEVELAHLRLFAQMYRLEPGISRQFGPSVQDVFDLAEFHPLKITVTIRHTDWWTWETDEHLHIASEWVNICRLPNSVKTFCVELESLERKKIQIEYVAEEMVNKWTFVRKDDVVLQAKAEDCTEAKWSGTSTWNNERWIRDESRPETLDYYIKTVMWKPSQMKHEERVEADNIKVPEHLQVRIAESDWDNLAVSDLHAAAVPRGLSADEAKKMVEDLRVQMAEFPNRDENGQDYEGAGESDEVESEDGESEFEY